LFRVGAKLGEGRGGNQLWGEGGKQRESSSFLEIGLKFLIISLLPSLGGGGKSKTRATFQCNNGGKRDFGEAVKYYILYSWGTVIQLLNGGHGVARGGRI